VNAVFEQAMELVPRLLAAILVSIIGAVLVTFSANFARTLARNAGMPNARLVSRLIKYSGNVLVVVIALDQVGFGRSVINSMFVIFFAALTFGLALAFGLGCKDLARDAMVRFLRNLREREERGTDLEG
jgi:small-conductance mechanosensitive channel